MTHAPGQMRPAIEWRTDVSLLGQPTIVGGLFKIVALSLCLMGGLVAFISLATGERSSLLPLLGLLAVCGGVVLVLLLFVVVVVFRNRMAMSFAVDADGAESATIDRRATTGARIATAAGVLTGNPGLAGAGLISASTLSRPLKWSAVSKVEYSPRWRTIRLFNSWRTVMILYCTRENYEEVAEAVRVSVVPHPGGGRRKNPVPGLLLRTALSIVACIPLFNLPLPIQVNPFIPVVVLCFALATIWFLPVFGWVVIGGLGLLAANALLSGMIPYTSRITGGTFPHYGLMSGDDWAVAAIAGLGAAFLIWLSVALLRGRYESALAGDERDMAG